MKNREYRQKCRVKKVEWGYQAQVRWCFIWCSMDDAGEAINPFRRIMPVDDLYVETHDTLYSALRWIRARNSDCEICGLAKHMKYLIIRDRIVGICVGLINAAIAVMAACRYIATGSVVQYVLAVLAITIAAFCSLISFTLRIPE